MRSLVILATATGLLLSARLAAGKPIPQRLVVRVYNEHGVSRGAVTTAAVTVRSMLKSVAINVVWRDCSPPAAEPSCDRVLSADEVIVRIVVDSQPPASSAALASSLMGQREPACLVTIWADRVLALAAAGEMNPAELLGRVLVHELGHVLIGSAAHSSEGLMRAEWTSDELRRGRRADWRFSAADARRW
jgi:hypothetical protein